MFQVSQDIYLTDVKMWNFHLLTYISNSIKKTFFFSKLLRINSRKGRLQEINLANKYIDEEWSA